jgi:short-subunit dehydrogenase
VALPSPSPSSTALVTGASSGIGAEIARVLAARGHGVTLTARREERLRELAEELAGEHGIRAEAIGCDLGDPAARDALAAEVEARGLEVEILVNNAGFGGIGSFVEMGRERQLDMVRLNIEAVVDLMGRYVPGMQGSGRGAVINIASTAAFQPMADNATYAATKAFVLSLGDATHVELRGDGVTVTSVCPGPVKSEFAHVAGIGAAEDRAPGFIWTKASDVAEQAVSGAERGKRVVVPGVLNQATALAGQHSPRSLALPLAQRIWSRAKP